MRIVSWNINSVRLRIDTLKKVADALQPDFMCLQETKAQDSDFPTDAITEAGFTRQLVRGMKGYNGVAILSNAAMSDGGSRDWCAREDCRHVAADIGDKTFLHNFYVPAGGDEPDPGINPKFDHKLAFLDEMKTWAASHVSNGSGEHVFTGDFNIAPLESDVWSHKQLLKIVSHTPQETERLLDIQSTCDLHDPVRAQIPEPAKIYSWWSYRSRDWEASDRGRRLDHIWVSKGLAGNCSNAAILKDVRGWERPSDHVPILVDIA